MFRLAIRRWSPWQKRKKKKKRLRRWVQQGSTFVTMPLTTEESARKPSIWWSDKPIAPYRQPCRVWSAPVTLRRCDPVKGPTKGIPARISGCDWQSDLDPDRTYLPLDSQCHSPFTCHPVLLRIKFCRGAILSMSGSRTVRRSSGTEKIISGPEWALSSLLAVRPTQCASRAIYQCHTNRTVHSRRDRRV